MITITKQNDGVLFTFENSDKYLYGNGSILVPFNSLSIIQDESDMITLRKAASNDIFLSARYDTDLGYRSKDEAVEALKGMLFAETGGGSGSGVTPSEVQEMIDESISGKADTSAVTAHVDDANVHFSGTQKSNYDGLEAQYYVDDNWDIMSMNVFNDFTNDYSAAMGQFDQRISANTSAIATKADTSAVTAVANDVQTVSGQVQTKVATSDFNAYSAATATALGNKQDALVYYSENTENKSANIHIENADELEGTSTSDLGVDGYGVSMFSSKTQQDGQEGSTLVDEVNISTNNGSASMYYQQSIDDEPTTHSNLDVGKNNIALGVDSDVDPMPYSHLNVGQNNISLEVMSDEDHITTFSVINSAVTINDENVATEPYVDAAISGKADTSAVTQVNNVLTAHTANTTVHVSQVEKAAWNSKANIDHVTQAEYSAMEQAGTLDSNTMYIIDDAVPFDPSTKVDVSAITSAITSGSTDSEIPTAKAVYDATQSGGGGATYSAGTNISIDTGNTISCTLPITVLTGSGSKNISVYASTNRFNTGSASKNGIAIGQANTATTGNYVVMLGQYNKASGDYTFAQGEHNEAMKDWSAAFGRYNNTNNYYEFATGLYNNSVTGSTDADRTLFSVGNGTSTSARHNAFEIRKNGDIYVNDGTNDVRLQDTILALGGLKLVKLTQSEYDNLPTKDSSTIYFITNVVS